MKRVLTVFSVVFTIIVFGSCAALVIGAATFFKGVDQVALKPSILLLEIKGVILDSRPFLEALGEFGPSKNIKGVLVRVDSPGGVVGASQELYSEIGRFRKQYKKPVVISAGSVMASGAYYAAVAGTKVVTNPGSLLGSIGVIMEFANLQDLYQWAKVKRFAIKTGPYKDSGSEYREMREDERKLFQDLVDQVHTQFIEAVAAGRKLEVAKVRSYADGRVFNGEEAVKLGFADQIGTYEDARRLIGKLTNLGEDPEIFEPPKKREAWLDLISHFSEDSHSKSSFIGNGLESIEKRLLPSELLNRPLFLMPGVWK